MKAEESYSGEETGELWLRLSPEDVKHQAFLEGHAEPEAVQEMRATWG